MKKNPKTKKGSREKTYFDSLDLQTLWEQFSLDIHKNGTPKYKTVWAFITKTTKVDWQRKTLYWILGPVVKGAPPKPFEQLPQFDWLTKRENGLWHSGSNVEQLKSKVKSQIHGLSKIAELGDINLDLIGTLKNVVQQINLEFGGGLFLAHLSAKENKERSKLYFELLGQAVQLSKLCQEMYGRTQGVELQALNQFLTMFANGMGQGAGIGASMGLFAGAEQTNSGIKSVSAQLIDMVASKAVDFEMDLPTEEMTNVVRNAKKPALVRKAN